jgi:hypothetical protein
MLQIGVTSVSRQCRAARRAIRDRLIQAGIEADHIVRVEQVTQELLVMVFDATFAEPLILTVEPGEAIIHVSVKTPTAVDIGDDPFGIRDNLLDGLTLAHGQHRHANGTVDLWATIERAH